MQTLRHRIDEVIGATEMLAEIRTRLTELDKERAVLELRAQRLLEGLASAAASASDAEPSPDDMTWRMPVRSAKPLTDRILEYLAQHPDFEYGASEIARALGLSGESNVNTVRGTLSRLKAENRILRAAYGKYRSKEEQKENAPSMLDEAL